MQLLRWVGIVVALLPGLLSAQTTVAVTTKPDEVAQHSLPAGRGGQKVEPATASPAETTAGTDGGATDAKAKPGVEEAAAGGMQVEPEKTQEQAAAGDASSVVDKLNQVVLEAMRRADELGYEGRFQRLAPVVREVYDFRAISRHVLGDYWKQLSQEQKEQFVEKMTEYGISEYAGQFDGYEGEKFVILSEAPFRKRYRVVKALLEVPKDDDVEFVYILRQVKGSWKIIDVRYDGVSDLALKRSQFAEILEQGGFERLIAKLDEKISDYARGNKSKKKS